MPMHMPVPMYIYMSKHMSCHISTTRPTHRSTHTPACMCLNMSTYTPTHKSARMSARMPTHNAPHNAHTHVYTRGCTLRKSDVLNMHVRYEPDVLMPLIPVSSRARFLSLGRSVPTARAEEAAGAARHGDPMASRDRMGARPRRFAVGVLQGGGEKK